MVEIKKRKVVDIEEEEEEEREEGKGEREKQENGERKRGLIIIDQTVTMARACSDD